VAWLGVDAFEPFADGGVAAEIEAALLGGMRVRIEGDVREAVPVTREEGAFLL